MSIKAVLTFPHYPTSRLGTAVAPSSQHGLYLTSELAPSQGCAPGMARSSCKRSPGRLSTCLSCLRDCALDAAGNGLPGRTSSWGDTSQTRESPAGAQSEFPSPALSPDVNHLKPRFDHIDEYLSNFIWAERFFAWLYSL